MSENLSDLYKKIGPLISSDKFFFRPNLSEDKTPAFKAENKQPETYKDMAGENNPPFMTGKKLRKICFAGDFKGHKSLKIFLVSHKNKLLSADGTGQIKLWNINSKECVKTLQYPYDNIDSISLSSKGKFLLTGVNKWKNINKYDYFLRLWDMENEKSLFTFEENIEQHRRNIKAVAFTPDGRWAVSGSDDRTLKVWDCKTGKFIHTLNGHTGGITSIAMSGDGQTVLSAGTDKTLKLWHIATGECLKTFEGHNDYIYSLSLSSDNKHAISAGGIYNEGKVEPSIFLWHIHKGELKKKFPGHSGLITSLVFSPDCKWFLSGSEDKTMKLWNIEKEECVETFKGHEKKITSVAFSHDMRKVFSAGEDKLIKIWELDWEFSLKDDHCRNDSIRVYLENFIYLHRPCTGELPEGREPSSEEIIWALTRRGKPEWTDEEFEKLLETLRYAGYGKLLPETVKEELKKIASEKEPPLSFNYCAVRKDLIKNWYIYKLEGHKERISSAVMNCDGTLALSGSYDKTISLWDIAERKSIRTFYGHTGSVLSVVFSSDNKFFLSGSEDRTLKLWNLSTGECIKTFAGHRERIKQVLLSGDMKRALSLAGDREIMLWNVTDGRCIQVFRGGHRDSVTSIAINKDGKKILTGSRDKTLKLWNDRGEVLRTFSGHSEYVINISMDFEGKIALSAGSAYRSEKWIETSLRLWDIDSGEAIHNFGAQGEIIYYSFLNPDGRWAISACSNNTVSLWNIENKRFESGISDYKESLAGAAVRDDGMWILLGYRDRELMVRERYWRVMD